ncbi:MAG: PD40 domain-containing protein [Bacteroidia bacterium]|nr:PD40 domain-containing protein [Bacteroidia bacterium]
MKKLLFIVCLFPALSWAQSNKISQKTANDYFTSGNYEEALGMFLSLLNDTPDDPKLNYKIAVCYLNSKIDKQKAIPFLEKVVALDKSEPNAVYLLGRAYHFANRFDDAIKKYEEFKENKKGSEANLKDAGIELQACYNAKELIKFPINVEFENLGKAINTSFSEEYPFVPKDESFILFNSRRENNSQETDGKYYSDIYISYVKNGKFQQARPLTNINTPDGDEQVIGLSANGTTAIFQLTNKSGKTNLYISKWADGLFSIPQLLPEVINSKHNEIAASLSEDGNTIYFASDRPGGFGGTDIYASRILPNGDWSEPQNLGPFVNTKYNEDFPNISSDGNTLLFSSKGHTTMGGYDIFKATFDENEKIWTNVRNIGYPLNTSDDDMNLCLSKDNQYGYMSCLRKGGMGDMDIYRVVFKDAEPEYTVYSGKITCIDDLRPIKEATLTVNRLTDGELMGVYLPNPQTMRYVIILPPGKYELITESGGFKTITENIEVLDKSSFAPYKDKDIKLVPSK